jgi:hypothetical protein
VSNYFFLATGTVFFFSDFLFVTLPAFGVTPSLDLGRGVFALDIFAFAFVGLGLAVFFTDFFGAAN